MAPNAPEYSGTQTTVHNNGLPEELQLTVEEDFPVLPLGQAPGHHEMLSRLRDHSLVDHVSRLERMEAEEIAQVRDLAADRVRVPLLLAGFLFDNRPPQCNCPTPSTGVQTSNSRRSGVRQRLLAQQYPAA